jgi:NAD+ synthase
LGVPPNICEKTPTADLEDHNPQQPDEASLGMTYEQIDDYLQGKRIDTEVQQKLEQRYRVTEHKRQLPVTPYCDWY